MVAVAITLSEDKYFEKYASWLREIDIEPVRITNPDSLSDFDILVLSGGGDLSVKTGAYDQPERTDFPLQFIKPERDELEISLLNKATENKMPVLGICRGLQIINVYCGGTLWPDISEGNFDIKLHRKHSGDDGDTEHEVDLVDSNFNVTSHHHLAIRKLGTNLSAIGHSEDGIIEAVKHTKFPWFAVQWHPERTSEGMGRSIPKEWLLQQIRNISNIQGPDSVA